MTSLGDQAHSGLEVVIHDGLEVMILDGLQVAIHDGLEVMTHQHSNRDNFPSVDSGLQVTSADGREVNFDRTGLEVVANDQYPRLDSDPYPASSGDQNRQRRHLRRLRRHLRILSIIGALHVVATAALAGILGLRIKNSRSPASSSPLSSSSPLNASTPIQRRHDQAGLSFSNNSVKHLRVYYQNNAGEVVEAASSP